MKNTVLGKLADYVSWALEQYRAIRENNSKAPMLRIISHEQSPEGILILVKALDRNLFAKFKASELVKDSIALNKFSPSDQQIIKGAAETGHFSQITTKPHLVSKALDKQNKKHLFSVESTQNGVRFIKQLYTDEILKNKKLLEQLNKGDIYEIAYSEGIESILIEKDEIEKAKKEAAKSKDENKIT